MSNSENGWIHGSTTARNALKKIIDGSPAQERALLKPSNIRTAIEMGLDPINKITKLPWVKKRTTVWNIPEQEIVTDLGEHDIATLAFAGNANVHRAWVVITIKN